MRIEDSSAGLKGRCYPRPARPGPSWKREERPSGEQHIMDRRAERDCPAVTEAMASSKGSPS